MLFTKVITFLIFLLGIYYITIFLHVVGLLKLTKKELSLNKSIIPFWYWFILFYSKDETEKDETEKDETEKDETEKDEN